MLASCQVRGMSFEVRIVYSSFDLIRYFVLFSQKRSGVSSMGATLVLLLAMYVVQYCSTEALVSHALVSHALVSHALVSHVLVPHALTRMH